VYESPFTGFVSKDHAESESNVLLWTVSAGWSTFTTTVTPFNVADPPSDHKGRQVTPTLVVSASMTPVLSVREHSKSVGLATETL